ncbi:unnamed protein product [Penicillium bialowiezense]
MAGNTNSGNEWGDGPADGPFPIPSVGGGTRDNTTEFLGTQHAERAINALVGKNGVIEMALFAEDSLKYLAKKANDAGNSRPTLLNSTRVASNSGNDRETGPGDGPFPIPSVGGGARASNTDYPGTPHARRAIDALVGKDGVIEMVLFAEDCLKDLPEKAEDGKYSEADRAELYETRLDILQALQGAYPGAQDAERATNALVGKNGIVEMANFLLCYMLKTQANRPQRSWTYAWSASNSRTGRE